jgi:SAM-dependent methyltransferase
MKSIELCPVCSTKHFEDFITCKDYTVSGELFKIVNCKSCGFKFTNPRPADDKLGDYYKSEDYISHSNTSKGIISKLYHIVRNYTLGKKEALVSGYVSRGTILDYGCGTGMFLSACKAKGWDCLGMEPDAGARKIGEGMGLKVHEDLASLARSLSGKKLDAITLWHVLEHVTGLEETLRFFKSELKPGGVLIVAVPNYTSADANHYKEHWAAYDVPRHLYHFEIGSISKLMYNHGFKLDACKPMKFDSFYVSMLSEKYKTGSIKYVSAFINGLSSNLKAKQAKDYSSVIYVFKHI